MSDLSPHVEPGDLITSDFFNQLLDRVVILEAQVAALVGTAGGGVLQILAVLPPGLVHLDEQIEIRGLGFDIAGGRTRVFFDDRRADPRPGSTDTRLLVVVPLTLQVPEQGRDVILTVTRDALSDTYPIRVGLPDVSVSGGLRVDFLEAVPAVLDPGQTVTLRYRITSELNRTSDVPIGVTTTPGSLADAITLLSESGTPLPESRVRLAPNENQVIELEIDPLPTAGTIGITLAATAGVATPGGSIRTFEIGGAVQPTDPNITLDFNGVDPVSGSTPTLVGRQLSLNPGEAAMTDYTLAVAASGNYTATVRLIAGAGQWEAVMATPSNGQLPNRSAGTQTPISYAVRALPTATADGRVELELRRVGSPLAKTDTLDLRVGS